MRRIRRWAVVGGGLLCCLALVWWIVQVTLLKSGERGEASGYGQFVLAAIGLLIVVAAAMRNSVRAPTTELPRLDILSDALAVAARNQWERAAVDRRLLEPAPLPIRWRRSALPVSGPLAAASAIRDGQARFDPLPGLTHVTAARLHQGTRRSLHAVYGGLASGRLVIIGPPGSGKSAAAILLLLDALRFREQAHVEDRLRIPVPVLFTLHGWNPDAVPLREWLVGKLAELPVLYGRHGARQAGQLLDAGRVSVFLDGLDEINECVRPLVLRALSEQATFRLVLLSRSAELVTAARHAHLVGGVALELLPIRPPDAADYLLRPQVSPAPAPWQAIADELTSGRTDSLTGALSNPLTITLLRDAYPAIGPVDELLDTTRFRTPDDIENHLLDHVLVAAYSPRPGQPRPRYSLDTARHTLRYIAAKLNAEGTRDLAWWHIPNWMPRRALAIPCALILGITVALTTTLGLVAAIGPRGAIIFGLIGGIVVGVTGGDAGSSHEGQPRRITPSRFRAPAARKAMTDTLAALTFIFGSGIILAMIIGLVMDAFTNWHMLGTFPNWLALGLTGIPISGLIAGMAFVLMFSAGELLPQPDDDGGPYGPVHLWRQNWAAGAISGFGVWLLVVVVFGLMDLLTVVSDARTRIGVVGGVTMGLGLGLAIGIVIALASTVGWLLFISQIHLAVRRRTPWSLLRFLEDARSRHVLRAVGPIYQFRHAKLQDRLSR